MENIQKHYTRDQIKKARQSFSSGLIVRQKEPHNLETPVDRVDSFLTPTELFYVRSHSPAPKLALDSYRLQIAGAVSSPFSLTYQELRDMPSEKDATIACALQSGDPRLGGHVSEFLVAQRKRIPDRTIDAQLVRGERIGGYAERSDLPVMQNESAYGAGNTTKSLVGSAGRPLINGKGDIFANFKHFRKQ